MKTKIAAAILLLLLVAGTIGAVKVSQIKLLIAESKTFAPPPETVSTIVAHEEKWQFTLPAIGTLTAVQGVSITPDIPGTVKEIAFESGAVVAKDALLVRLDTSSEEAQLRAVEAQVDLARITLGRAQTLLKEKTVAQSEVDTAEATLKQNQANADNIRATIAKKTIRAPFAGRLGIRSVDLGQYLETGRAIVSLQALDKLYVNFSLPQQEISKLKPGMEVRLTTDAYTNRAFGGTLSAINPDLDQSTRTIALQATLDNPDQLLRPGMFIKVEVLLPEAQTVLIIPATAVLSAPYGNSVYIVEPGTNTPPGLVVRQQFVRTGAARGDLLSVETGLKPGEKIVSTGLFKLLNGMSVIENNELTPKAEGNLKPTDS